MLGIKQLEFTYLSGPEEGKTFTFKSRSVSIGSARGCDLIIKDRYINAEHAVVSVEDNGIVLQNRAVNGATFVNGTRVERCLIENDDQIAFGGGIALKFRASDVTEGFQAPFRTPAVASFRLMIVGGVLKGMTYDFAKERVTLGSKRGCDLLLSDSGVDEEHAQIVSEGAEMVLYNECEPGTKVNGKFVERQVLHTNDKIEIGSAAITFQEVLGDVRLAKPRRFAQDGTPLQRAAKGGGSIFSNPIVLAALVLYFFGLVFVVLFVVGRKRGPVEIAFGGGFGFHSVARGVYVAKSIGQEHYESPLVLTAPPDSGRPFRVVSGNAILYDTDRPLEYPTSPNGRKALANSWPKSPPYRRAIISDSAEANKCLAMARQHFSNRNLNPSALHQTVWYLRRAEAFCPDSEATTKAAIRDELKEGEIELFEFYEDSWERAYIKGRAKDFSGAVDLYEFLRKLVPDDKNPGNQYARAAQLSVIPHD